MRFFGHNSETRLPEDTPVASEISPIRKLYDELGTLIAEARTIPEFPRHELMLAIGQYEAARVTNFHESGANENDLRDDVSRFCATVERYRPTKRPELPPVSV